MELKLLKGKHFALSSVLFIAAYMSFFIYFCASVAKGDFYFANIIWLIIDIPLFGIGIYGLYKENKTYVSISSFALFSYNAISSLISSANNIDKISLLNGLDSKWALTGFSITAFITSIIFFIGFIFFIFIRPIGKLKYNKIFTPIMLLAILFSLVSLIFIIIVVAYGTFSWYKIFDLLMYIFIICGLFVNGDYLASEY